MPTQSASTVRTDQQIDAPLMCDLPPRERPDHRLMTGSTSGIGRASEPAAAAQSLPPGGGTFKAVQASPSTCRLSRRVDRLPRPAAVRNHCSGLATDTPSRRTLEWDSGTAGAVIVARAPVSGFVAERQQCVA